MMLDCAHASDSAMARWWQIPDKCNLKRVTAVFGEIHRVRGPLIDRFQHVGNYFGTLEAVTKNCAVSLESGLFRPLCDGLRAWSFR
jgi:hypothetical protein